MPTSGDATMVATAALEPAVAVDLFFVPRCAQVQGDFPPRGAPTGASTTPPQREQSVRDAGIAVTLLSTCPHSYAPLTSNEMHRLPAYRGEFVPPMQGEMPAFGRRDDIYLTIKL